MTDTVVFTDDDGTLTFDPDTGEYTTTAGTVLYSGPCQVQVTDTIPRDATVGEQQIVVERIIVKIPWDAAEVPPNSVGTITAVGEGSGSVVGRRYRVIGTNAKTYNTARRLPCELVTP
jgi:hypothetical protein